MGMVELALIGKLKKVSKDVKDYAKETHKEDKKMYRNKSVFRKDIKNRNELRENKRIIVSKNILVKDIIAAIKNEKYFEFNIKIVFKIKILNYS